MSMRDAQGAVPTVTAAAGPEPLLSVHSVHRCVTTVVDLDEAERFYRAFGLEVRREDDRLEISAFGAGHAVLHVVRADRNRLRTLSFGVYEKDLPRFADKLDRSGVSFAAAAGVLQLRDADGTAIELVAARKTSPDTPAAIAPRTVAPKRSGVAAVHPTQFSHLLLFSSDVNAAVAFYCGVLGFRLSDRSGDGIAFLHSPHGSDHHLVAFVKSEGPGLHHTSWQVRSLDEVGHGAMQLSAKGYEKGWGLGRHVLGSNYFHYAKAPWGGYVEYSFDMEHIAAGSEWKAGDHEAEDSFYVWGPPPPGDFATNTELG